jgi:predicted permease
VVILGIGGGAAAATVSVIEALFFRALPVKSPEQLAYVYLETPQGTSALVGYADFDLQKELAKDLGEFGARWPITAVLGDVGSGSVSGEAVTWNYFDVVGVSPFAGRTFAAVDPDHDSGNPVVISHDLWVRYLNRDAAAIGRTLRIRDVTFTVVAIMPAGFRGISDVWEPSQFWVPLSGWRPEYRQQTVSPFIRLRDEITPLDVQERISSTKPQNDYRYVVLTPGEGGLPLNPKSKIIPARFINGSLALLVAMFTAAAANSTGLLLLVSLARRAEFRVRQALGEPFHNLITQIAVEGALVGLASIGVAVLVGNVLTNVFRIYGSAGLIPPVDLSWKLLIAMSALFVGVAVSVSLVPVAMAVRGGLRARLVHQVAPPRSRTGAVLVIAQLAVTVSVATAAVNGAVYFGRITVGSLGYDTSGFFVSPVVPRTLAPVVGARNVIDATEASKRTVREFLALAPASGQFLSVALANRLPFVAPAASSAVRSGEGTLEKAVVTGITPDYFSVVGATMSDGDPNKPLRSGEAMLSESLAAALWGSERAIGKQLIVGGFSPEDGHSSFFVVGVVRNLRPLLQEQANSHQVFVSLQALAQPGPLFVLVKPVRTDWRPESFQDLARASGADVLSTQSVETVVTKLLFPRRLSGSILLALAIITCAIAAIGVYSLVTYSCKQREREFGVRLALGAGPIQIGALVIEYAAKLGVVGLVAGAGLGYYFTRILASITAVSMPGFTVYLSVALALAVVIALATFGPMLSAMRVDPKSVLKET